MHCFSENNRHWKIICPHFLLPQDVTSLSLSLPSHSREDRKYVSGMLAQTPEWDVKPGLMINFLLSIHLKADLSDNVDKATQCFTRDFLQRGGKRSSSSCIRISVHHCLRISLITLVWTLTFTSLIHPRIVRKNKLTLETEFIFCVYSVRRDSYRHQERMQRVITNSYPSEKCLWKYSNNSSSSEVHHLTKSHLASEQKSFTFLSVQKPTLEL